MTDYRLTAADHASLLADLDDAASRAGGLLSRTTRPRTLLRSLEPWVDVEPEPEPARVLFGANPWDSGKRPDVGDIATVESRYGLGAAVRLFDGTGVLNPAPARVTPGHSHFSWKPDQAAVTAGLLRAEIGVAIAPARDGDFVEGIHEADVKDLDPAATLAFRRVWVETVKSTRPDLDVPFTIGGWRFEKDDNKGGPDQWLDCIHACDLLGVDLDGTPVKALPYKDYRPIIDKIVAWMGVNGIARWTVPELAVKRAPDDPDGVHRAAWITQQAKHMIDLGALAPERVCWFESSSYPGTELTMQVERDALAALV